MVNFLCYTYHRIRQEEYESLRQGLSDFLVKLLDEVRGDVELDVLLNGDVNDDDDVIEVLSRLKLALYYDEKKVCH